MFRPWRRVRRRSSWGAPERDAAGLNGRGQLSMHGSSAADLRMKAK